jgi:radical SAM protein with 4Fe4S-binding SPASM domain
VDPVKSGILPNVMERGNNMIQRRHSRRYNFWGDTDTGMTMRWGDTPEDNPVYAPWPELADISISNHCSKNCEFCYRDSKPDKSFIPLDQYEFILERLRSDRWGSVFQVALGGGEPLEHPDFVSIIQRTHRSGVVANFTTNGEYLDSHTVNAIKGKVGAVALSVDRMANLDATKVALFADAGIRTNLHYILDNQSLPEATEILEGRWNHLLHGINGIVFLTFKPKGRGSEERCLEMGPEMERFISLIQSGLSRARVGFDACFVPVLMRHTHVNTDYIDSCECGFFSVYIDEKLNVKPCSFSLGDAYTFNLAEYDMEDIWQRKYEAYREEILNNLCSSKDCDHTASCHGKCMYYDCLSFCYESGEFHGDHA